MMQWHFVNSYCQRIQKPSNIAFRLIIATRQPFQWAPIISSDNLFSLFIIDTLQDWLLLDNVGYNLLWKWKHPSVEKVEHLQALSDNEQEKL